MKKQLLSFLFAAAAFSASAQLNTAGDGYTSNFLDGSSNCYGNSAPSNAGIMSFGSTFTESYSNITEANGPLVLVSADPEDGTKTAHWFALPVITGEGIDAACSNLYSEDQGIDMSNNTKITVTAESSIAGAELSVFLGSGGQWSPTYNTAWTGSAEIGAKHTFAEANTLETFTVDLATVSAEFTSWPGISNIQSLGYLSWSPTATFKITEVKLGAEAIVDDGNGNDDEDDNGGDDNGNGQACATTSDDGLAQATFYNLIANGSSTVVRCAFDVVNKIKGTNYGALETATLQEDSDAKYCGMCVEMTGENGTAIVQIVDECPDCWEHNSGDTDIDLSPSAFAAVVGDQSIGRSDITWEEVSCPWSTPIDLRFESAHEWNVKVIIANHVNRIDKVEITHDGQWVDMERGADNGWVKGSLFGQTKSIRVTDIYGSQITMENLDFSTTLSWVTVTGTEQFPACGLTTSANELNTLDYISLYPNPANNSITFEGIEDVRLMEIVNINGQVVANKNFQTSSNQISLDISNLAPGIYVAKMTGNTNTGVATFVKK